MRATTFDITSTSFASMLLSAFVLTVLWAAASIAKADPAIDPAPSVVVKFDDLDLGSSKGAQTLYRRITSAAEQVCPYADHRDLSLRSTIKSCQQAALDRAMHRLSPQQLAALTKIPRVASLH